MRAAVAITLAKHIGATLTLDLAKQIAAELLAEPDLTIDPLQFVPQEYRGYVLACERLSDILSEIHPLHEEHFAETEQHLAGIPLNMDYPKLLARERSGQLLQFTAREKATGVLVGNMRVYIATSVHTQRKFSTEDTFFVTRAHRGGFMAVRLWQYAERCGAQIGVCECYFDSKTVNKADRMATYLGYTPIAIKFAKVFDKEGAAHVRT